MRGGPGVGGSGGWVGGVGEQGGWVWGVVEPSSCWYKSSRTPVSEQSVT